MKTLVMGITAACVLVAGSAFASEDMAGKYSCYGCHSVTANKEMPDKYGPYFVDIADKYKDKGDNAIPLLTNSILRGSKNKWDRPIDMPPRAECGMTIDEENAQKMAEWIMSLQPSNVAGK